MSLYASQVGVTGYLNLGTPLLKKIKSKDGFGVARLGWSCLFHVSDHYRKVNSIKYPILLNRVGGGRKKLVNTEGNVMS